jgi:subtilisin family serine protease
MAFEYVVKGNVIKLPVNPDKIAVQFREPSGEPERRAVIDPKPEVGSFDDRYEVPNEKLTVVDVARSSGPGPMRVAAAAGALNADPEVERASPVFDLGSKQVVAPNRIIVGFKPEANERAAQIIRDCGGEVVRLLGDGNEYVLRLSPLADPFDVIATLTKYPEVEYAEPDFITIGLHRPRNVPPGESGGVPDPEPPAPTDANGGGTGGRVGVGPEGVGPNAPGDDPLLKFQYAARITRAVEAWQMVAGSRAVKIAILDEGVDAGHPDLREAIAGSYDAVDSDANQQPNPWDAHGTACAGLAAAIPQNGRGVRGIGGGCSLMAVRIAYSKSKGDAWVWVEQNVVGAIDWAWRNGADVLSNSWGGGAPSNAIINAFERARTKGRGGLGCVIIVAAGNDSGPVDFPGKLDTVLTVSASNEFDEPKTKTGADGETWWGSNFGPPVDVAAPGVHNYTTDIVGADGYNDGGATGGDYVTNFNGTSSATPIVAGLAGLILSSNPSLRESQVRRLIKETADKVGQIVYTNGRNDQMGHGRVNALRAVQLAPSFV